MGVGEDQPVTLKRSINQSSAKSQLLGIERLRCLAHTTALLTGKAVGRSREPLSITLLLLNEEFCGIVFSRNDASKWSNPSSEPQQFRVKHRV